MTEKQIIGRAQGKVTEAQGGLARAARHLAKVEAFGSPAAIGSARRRLAEAKESLSRARDQFAALNV